MITRESLKEFYMQIVEAPSPSNRWLPEIVCEQVDLIFDELESRTCENCKYWWSQVVDHPNYRYCNNDKSMAILADCHKDFGCNKWEAKTVSTDTKEE